MTFLEDHLTLFCSTFGLVPSWSILLLHAPHGDVPLPAETFRDIS